MNGLGRGETLCLLHFLYLQALVLKILLYSCKVLHVHLPLYYNVSFCLQITLPSVPFKGQNCNGVVFDIDLKDSAYINAFDFGT